MTGPVTDSAGSDHVRKLIDKGEAPQYVANLLSAGPRRFTGRCINCLCARVPRSVHEFEVPRSCFALRVSVRSHHSKRIEKFVVSPFLIFGSEHGFGQIPAPAGLRSFCFAVPAPSGSGSPILVPPEKHLFSLGGAATRFRVPQDTREEKDKNMYLNRLTLIGFIGTDAEKKAGTSGAQFTVFSLATKRSWKNTAGEWESRTERSAPAGSSASAITIGRVPATA